MTDSETIKPSPKLKDLTGQVFGRLTVIARGPNTKLNQATWVCQCTCGTIRTVAGTALRFGLTRTCGPCGAADHGKLKTVDIINQRFGNLVVINRAGSTDEGKALWLCQCDCGTIKILPGKELRNGHTVSCTCAKRQRIGSINRTHAMSTSREYKAWKAAKQRCTNPSDFGYPNYGGRGIKMCEEWLNSFEAFYAHIGPRPPGTSIDRIDNDGNYEPGNVRWATWTVQMNNTRRNKRRPRH